ncbi:hypothetical protein GCK32_022394 [Trichostrongylus colubriformis]|uniref:Uncharacterized protein n=1 Tax=Trichostrongylus colubriformis TaxID=6319 RepID=A0AAN8ES47_TRICO
MYPSASTDLGPLTHRRKSVGESSHAHQVSDDDEQIRKCSHARKVHFDDEHLVSGYFAASVPMFSSIDTKNEGRSGEFFWR